MEAYEFLFYVAPVLVLVYGGFLLFIRPPKKVWLWSLLGGLVTGIINLLVDIVAYKAHWWEYTFRQPSLDKSTALQTTLATTLTRIMDITHVPLPLYITPILVYGSLVFLLIWRLNWGKLRWLSRLLLIATPVFCIVRSILDVELQNSLQTWENFPLAVVATIVLWLVAFYAGYALFWRTASGIEYKEDTTEDELPWHASEQRAQYNANIKE
jgi:hypothetical protein